MKDALPTFRALVKDNAENVYHFVMCMLPAEGDRLEVVLAIFRKFGAIYSREARRGELRQDPLQARVGLFQVAWRLVRRTLADAAMSHPSGRDIRGLKAADADLLEEWAKGRKGAAPADIWELLCDRLMLVDVDFRAAVVLRDVLRMQDEEVAKILGLRWGVYRHRLHRGRLETLDVLQGGKTAVSGGAKHAPDVLM